MNRIILHIDANCFFASVETAYNPSLIGFPVAVTGDAQARHGIILTANYIAKRTFGIKTGETIISAKSKCPKLITIKSNPKNICAIAACFGRYFPIIATMSSLLDAMRRGWISRILPKILKPPKK